jgi:hypothetical protein
MPKMRLELLGDFRVLASLLPASETGEGRGAVSCDKVAIHIGGEQRPARGPQRLHPYAKPFGPSKNAPVS